MIDPEADEQCSARKQNAADVRVQSAGDEVSRGQGSSHSRAADDGGWGMEEAEGSRRE
jgi:hypothetical protein